LQFVPGTTLRQCVQLKGALDENLVRELAAQIAEILHYLHNFDDPIIHRDITPDNLVLNEASGQLTLIDFGAANEVALQSSSTIIGKQCYIAPEQLRGAACIQSDLFSLGATMYFLLTGADPVPISTSRPLQVKNTVSKAMNELVARLTDMEAGCRPGSAKLVIDILNHPQLMQTSGSP
jgi:serine/threonine protein kinase